MNQKGVTLIELLAVLSLMGLMLGLMSSAYSLINIQWKSANYRYQDDSQTRLAINKITNELKDSIAAYYVENGSIQELRFLTGERESIKTIYYAGNGKLYLGTYTPPVTGTSPRNDYFKAEDLDETGPEQLSHAQYSNMIELATNLSKDFSVRYADSTPPVPVMSEDSIPNDGHSSSLIEIELNFTYRKSGLYGKMTTYSLPTPTIIRIKLLSDK